MTSTAARAEIRAATPDDVPALAELMGRYMRETFQDEWHGSAEALSRDGFGQKFEMQVGSVNGDIVGFLAWTPAYDLHHCTTGAEVIDMYVLPAFRGRTIGPLLVAAAAAEARRRGGLFLKGQAVDDPAVRRLYARLAVSFAAVDCTLAGRAFRTVADLARASPKALVRSLPQKSWNYEA